MPELTITNADIMSSSFDPHTDDDGMDWKDRRVIMVSLFLPWTIAPSNQTIQVRPTDKSSTMKLLSLQERKQVESFHRRQSFVSTVSSLSTTVALSKQEQEMQSWANAANSSGLMTESSALPSISKSSKDNGPDVMLSGTGNVGLYNALSAVDNMNRLWLGTVGNCLSTVASDQRIVEQKLEVFNAVPVFIPKDEMDGHYDRICKQVLWKSFHSQLPEFEKSKGYDEVSWKHYVSVNQRFADTIARVYRPGDMIWINDYHLMLVPGMVRKLIPGATIGFFLHIPFPSSEIFRCLHVRKQILQGLLGADMIGFQTYSFMRHFLMTCTRLLSLDSTPKGIQLDNSQVSVGIFPIGINLEALNEKRQHSSVKEMMDSLREKYAGKRILIGRDKNDYVKGVRQKLLSFERFLKEHPEWHGKVVLIQVALSTTEANENESHVTDVVSRINSTFGSIEYVPVVYLHQDISFYHYLALLTVADACIITSLRDGMNLTSHEYVVCQEEKHSPLIISEFAGTYGSFGAALRVNPWDSKEVADAIHEALTMGAEEKYYRWKVLYSYVSGNSARNYVDTFLTDLGRVHEENRLKMSSSIPKLSFEQVGDVYVKSRRRALFIDDDGTMISWSKGGDTRADSETFKRMRRILQTLCQDPNNMVYLMSGRPRKDLECLFDIPFLGICAENGCFLKYTYDNEWEEMLQDQDFSWRKNVQTIFEYYTDRTTGSYIEQKEICLGWHYELADADYGAWQAAECQNHIQNTLGATYPIHILAKKKSVEVMPRNTNKGSIIRRVLEQHYQSRSRRHTTSMNQPLFPHHTIASRRPEGHIRRKSSQTPMNSIPFFTDEPLDLDPGSILESDMIRSSERIGFILAMGDDRSDEYMFEYLDRIAAREKERGHHHTRQTSGSVISDASFSFSSSTLPRSAHPVLSNANSGTDGWGISLESLPSPALDLTAVSMSPATDSSYLASPGRLSESLSRSKKRTIVTCTVGRKSTAAKWHLANMEEVLTFLESLGQMTA